MSAPALSFDRPHPPLNLVEPNWSAIPPLRIVGSPERLGPAAFSLPTSAGPLRIDTLAWGVRLRLGRQDQPDYGILAGVPEAEPAEIGPGDIETTIAWGGLRLDLRHEPLAIELRRGDRHVVGSCTDAHFVREFRLPPFARVEGGWLVCLDVARGAPVYGLGEKWGRLNKKSQLVHSLTHDALGVNAERSYKNAPFAWSPDGWGVYAHTPSPVYHAVGFPQWSHRAYGLLVEDEGLDLFLFSGETPAEIVGAFTGLVGRTAMPPLWSLGAILSKAYYRDADELLAAAREVRARGMPCDTITLDGRAWQDTETRFHFGFDPKRYPDPKAIVDELHGLDLRLCVWEYPLVAEKGPHHAELAAKNWLIKDRRTGRPYTFRFDPEPFGEVLTQLPDSGLVDFTHPDAYAWWRDQHRALFEAGVDMIKADFGEQVEPHCLAYNGDTGHRLRNVYPLLYNRCVFEAAEMYGRGACLLSRSGWVGSGRYPAQWGGDPQADWGGFVSSLRGGLSWGMSGAATYATDIGGFYGDRRDPELYVRWAQAAVFSSHMRFHGIGERTPWSYGEDAERAVREALSLRYRLLPYVWEALQAAAATGLPVQRAMPLAWPDDPAAWGFEDQFMFGSDILVSPTVEPGGRTITYLPHGRWRHLLDGSAFEGGRVLDRTLALDEIAAFVRDGAAIPLGPEVDRTFVIGETPRVAERRRYA